MLEKARAVLDTEPVCDACLGRCFADRGRGVTNEERGHALRVSVALMRDEPIGSVEPDDCWVCEGLVPDYSEWADRTDRTLEDLEFETFLVGTHAPPFLEENETALREQAELDADAGEPLKDECNREVGRRLERSLDAIVDHSYPDVVAVLNLERDEVELQLNPAFLFGRYRKFERGLGQRRRICRVCNGRGTQWREGEAQPCENCGGSGYITEKSVERFITQPIKEGMVGTDTVFNCAGREADDIRMLGTGRPFVVEVKEPRRRPPNIDDLQSRINSEQENVIEVEGLTRATKDMVEHVTQTPIRQTYRLTVTFATAVSEADFTEALDALDTATIHQQVDRDDRTIERIRTLDQVNGELTDQREALVELDSDGELDLEALVSGGDGLTEPNLANLLQTEVEAVEIDVIVVEGAEEPIEKSAYLHE